MKVASHRAQALLAAIATAIIIVLSGCGGGDGEPSGARFVQSIPIGGPDARPLDVIIDSNRTLYVLAAGSWQAKKYTITGALLGDFIDFLQPTAANFGPNQDIYLVSPDVGRVAVFDLAGQRKAELETALPSGTRAYGVAADATGQVYLWAVDELASPMAWNILLCTGGTCSLLVSGGPTTPIPTGEQQRGMAVDREGNIYYPDPNNDRIVVFDPLAQQGWTIGSPGSAPGELNEPHDVAVDLMGDIYVADSGNDRIQKFSREGEFLFTVGGQGTADGQFQSPQGVAVDSLGFIVVADTGNNRVQVFVEF